jgi:hypothetical protein
LFTPNEVQPALRCNILTPNRHHFIAVVPMTIELAGRVVG